MSSVDVAYNKAVEKFTHQCRMALERHDVRRLTSLAKQALSEVYSNAMNGGADIAVVKTTAKYRIEARWDRGFKISMQKRMFEFASQIK